MWYANAKKFASQNLCPSKILRTQLLYCGSIHVLYIHRNTQETLYTTDFTVVYTASERPHLLQLVGQLVDLQDEVLEGVLGSPLGVQEQPQLLLSHSGPAVEHLKGLGHPTKHPYHSPDQLVGREVLAGVQDVCGLLGHGARDVGGGTATSEGVAGEFRVLKEGREEGAHRVHGGGVGLCVLEQVGLAPDQILSVKINPL